MGERAWVDSVEALMRFRAALCKFAEAVGIALGEAEAEIHRTSFWLKQEQQAYWKGQVDRRSELRARAKSALSRKRLQKTALGSKFSYVDEEKALAAAERQLEEARQKLANVRRWSRLLDEESSSYLGAAQNMSQAVDVDVPSALAQLDNMISALEAYASSGTPSEQRSTAPVPFADEFGRPEDYASVARPTPPPSGGVPAAYQCLRAQTPSREVRDGTPISEPQLEWAESGGPALDLRDALADLDLACAPVAADDKIVMARGASQHQRTYLERVPSAAAGDSGWYFGFADETPVTGYDAVRIADFLAGRPDLAAALELPAGYLAVLDGMSLEAVLDAQSRLLWSAAHRGNDD
jgi:hypothetical protein